MRNYEDNVSNLRTFCGKCGSPLFISNPNHANVIIVASGTLDDAPEKRPNVEFHCKRRAGWLGEIEGATRFEGVF